MEIPIAQLAGLADVYKRFSAQGSPPIMGLREPSLPQLSMGVTPGQPVSERLLQSIGPEGMATLMQTILDAQAQAASSAAAPSKVQKPKKPKQNDIRPGALGLLALASLLMNSAEQGAGTGFVQGYMGQQNLNREDQYQGEVDRYNEELAVEDRNRKMAEIEFALRNQDFARLDAIRNSQAKAGQLKLDHERDIEKINAQFGGRSALAGINNESAEKRALINQLPKVAPEYRPEIAGAAGLPQNNAGALTPNEKLQNERTNDLKETRPQRMKNLIREGKLKDMRLELMKIDETLKNLRVSAEQEKHKWYPRQLAAQTKKLEVQAQKAITTANDAVVGAASKVSATTIFNAINKIEQGETEMGAAAAMVMNEVQTLKGRLSALEGGQVKNVNAVEVADMKRELLEAIDAAESKIAYYEEMKLRLAARKKALKEGMSFQQVNANSGQGTDPVRFGMTVGPSVGQALSGPIGR